ncbi:MAG: hypothetical protein ACLPSF_11320, partial [Methylocella sp.]
RAAGRGAPRGASPRSDANTAAGMDVSWIQSARARASAAQMAHRVAAAAEPKRTNAGDRLHWKPEDSIENWRSAAREHSPPSADPDPDEGDAPQASSGPATAAETPEPPLAAVEQAPLPAAVRPNPVHALWRLLGHIPGGWRAGAGFLAAALGSVRTARGRPAPAKPAGPDPKSHGASAHKSEDETIAEELGLRADLAIVDLRRIRRDFAKKNHPDRFEPAQRLSAARRMTIANMLIDARLKQRPPAL